jgi:multiple sugar transport system permease protein
MAIPVNSVPPTVSSHPYDSAVLRRNQRIRTVVTWLTYALLIVIAITTIFPYFFMISSSFKPREEIIYFRLLPVQPTLENYVRVLTRYPFGRWYLNSLLVTVVAVTSTLFFASMAGYALSKFTFRGRDFFFTLILASIMVPSEMLVIPWYVGANRFGLVDTYPGVIFPALVDAFSVFVLRQAIFNVPNELIDAARVDGMPEIGIYFRIILPLVSGALAALGILITLGVWNDYLWPLIILQDIDMYTLQVGITYAATTYAAESISDWTLIMTATTIASVPMLLLVIFSQQYLVKGITLTGLKG